MIWHIFKKDWKLLWPLVAIVAAGRFVSAGLSIELGHFGEPRELAILSFVFQLVLVLGFIALVISVAHQDTLPGDRHDWLTRPIQRRDLLAAKLLFLLIAVHGPVVLANLVTGSAEGLPFGDTLSAALASSIALFLMFSLALFGAAAMTGTVGEILIAGVAIVISVMGAGMAARAFARPVPFADSGLAWMESAADFSLAFIATMIVIPLQYFHRATLPARGIALIAVLLAMAFSLTRWPQAFALQQAIAPDQTMADSVAIAYAPSLGKAASQGDVPYANLVLPVRVSGLPADSFVKNDHAEVRLVDRDGTTLYRTEVAAPGSAYAVDFSPVQTADGGDVTAYQYLALPAKIIDRFGDQPVRMEIDDYLTLFHIDGATTIAAVNGDERSPTFGSCKSRIDDDGDEIEVGCLKAGHAPSCITAALENHASGLQNPTGIFCRRDYSPGLVDLSGAINQFKSGARYRDRLGLAKFPVDSTQLPDAQVTLKSYRPVAHFTRHLTIPEIRLSDWATVPHTGNEGSAP